MKPVFFISSTIKDFKDLRSCIKWWLEENEYTVYASEFNDFIKPLDKNSYEACLKTIDKSDYFILLMGDRIGGMYDDNITITQKEYRQAYERMLSGKLKIINLIRHDTWTTFKHTQKKIKELEKIKPTIDFSFNPLVNNEEEILFRFINEVRRVDEMKDKKLPKNNWIHSFNTFKDITEVLKNELGNKLELSFKQKRFIILNDIKRNLKLICSKIDGKVYPVGSMNSKLFKDFELNFDKNEMTLSNEQWVFYASFYFSCMQIKPLIINRIETFYSSGFFLDYNKDINDFVSGDLNLLATNLITIYEHLNGLHKLMFEGENNKLQNLIKKADNSHLNVTSIEIMFALDYSDNLFNCLFYSKSLYNALAGSQYHVPKLIWHNRIPENLRQKEKDILTDKDIEDFLNTP